MVEANHLYQRQIHSLQITSIPYSFLSCHCNTLTWFYSYYQVLWQYQCLLSKSIKHYQTSHEDYPPYFSPNSQRFFSAIFCFITSLSVLIFYYLGKNLLLQMTCFLNMKNEIGTVCPHNVFWTKAIQDEDKLLKRTNHFSQLHYHWFKQGYWWGERLR